MISKIHLICKESGTYIRKTCIYIYIYRNLNDRTEHLYRQLSWEGTDNRCPSKDLHLARRFGGNRRPHGRARGSLGDPSTYPFHPTGRCSRGLKRRSTSDPAKSGDMARHHAWCSWSQCPANRFLWSNSSRPDAVAFLALWPKKPSNSRTILSGFVISGWFLHG